jgi:hypothetical protein
VSTVIYVYVLPRSFQTQILRIWLSCRDERHEVSWSLDFIYDGVTSNSRYEKIQALVDRMERTFETQGCVRLLEISFYWTLTIITSSYFWVSDNSVLCQQKGVFRVNCIDCLDRTNVVQVSAQILFLSELECRSIVVSICQICTQ